MDVTIYSKPNCSFCDRAKNRLSKHKPKIHILGQDYTREYFFKKFPNAKTFPQIIINDKHIGTYNELEKWIKMNSFDEKF